MVVLLPEAPTGPVSAGLALMLNATRIFVGSAANYRAGGRQTAFLVVNRLRWATWALASPVTGTRTVPVGLLTFVEPTGTMPEPLFW